MSLLKYPSFIPKPQEIPGILPGLAVSCITALIAMLLAMWIPNIGAGPIAIGIGILAGNLYFKQPILSQGTKFSEGRLLEYAIVLLGFSVTFETLAHLGFAGTLYIMLQISSTIILALLIGKLLRFSKNYALLMAAGNAVCGSSAIAAVAPVIRAKEAERGLIITIVNLMGTVMMFLLPVIAIYTYDSKLLQGAFIGGILQSVGQVIASSSMLGSEVMRDATLFKIMRIASLIIIVLLFHRLAQNGSQAPQSQESQELNKGNNVDHRRAPRSFSQLFKLIPWYLFGFIIACALNSLSLVSDAIVALLLSFSHGFEVIALAAIGLRLNFMLLKQQGGKLALYALLLGTGQIIMALLLIGLFLG